MPRKSMKPCKHPGCPNLTEDTYCSEHRKSHVEDRPNAVKRGYNSKWRSARNKFLESNPFCVRCKEQGKLVEATVVDHVKPHRGDRNMFWDESNWQPLCKSCHDKKTMTEDRYEEYKY